MVLETNSRGTVTNRTKVVLRSDPRVGVSCHVYYVGVRGLLQHNRSAPICSICKQVMINQSLQACTSMVALGCQDVCADTSK